MATFASTHIPTSGATATRNADILPFPFPARPQAMTIYLRIVELGTILMSADTRVLTIGAVSNAAPRIRIYSGDGVYRATHDNGFSTGIVNLVEAPSVGDPFELMFQCNPTGAIKLIQSIDGAAETTTSESSDVIFADQWSAALLSVNSRGSASTGVNAFRNIVIHRGVQSLTTMRRLAGVI